ncbi:replication initiation protein [Paraburkholderia sp. 32]|uniref:replication initiation protein n=1 Tax=Paraburkholderia sp. 32 TaxID=2991057 RepID=UPI003D244731
MSKNISPWNGHPRRVAGEKQLVWQTDGLIWVSAQVLSVIYFIAYSNTALTAAFPTGKEQDWHEVDLSFFAWLLRVDSEDLERLKRMLRVAQKVLYVGFPMSHSTEFVAVPFVGTCAMAGGRLGFSVNTNFLRYISSQESPGALPLEFKPDLPSTYARSLYANLSQRAHEEHASTDWIPLDVVRSWPGKSRASTARAHYFLQRIVATAIREINERSDVEIEWETASCEHGSKDISVRFAIKRKDPAALGWEYLRARAELFPACPQRALLSSGVQNPSSGSGLREAPANSFHSFLAV